MIQFDQWKNNIQNYQREKEKKVEIYRYFNQVVASTEKKCKGPRIEPWCIPHGVQDNKLPAETVNNNMQLKQIITYLTNTMYRKSRDTEDTQDGYH